MNTTILRGRPEERFKFSIGLLAGTVVALPLNILNIANWQLSTGLAYVLIAGALVGIAFRRRSFILGTCAAIIFVSLPQASVTLLPMPLTNWHVSAGVLWLVALAILGCLYLMREAETRTNADIDANWLFRPQE